MSHQAFDRRRPLGHLGNQGWRYQGGYRGSRACYEEDEAGYDYEEEYYEEDPPFEDLSTSYSSQGSFRPFIRYPCSNCQKTDRIVKDCPLLKCYTCNKTFDTLEQRKSHWHAEHRVQSRATSNLNTPDRRPYDNKRRGNELASPHLRAVHSRRSDRLKIPHSSSKSFAPIEPEYDYYGR
jgi:hypothetical protein